MERVHSPSRKKVSNVEGEGQEVKNEICRALAYIHNCIGLCHHDIKPQNLLIYSQCNIYEAGQKKKTFEYYTEKAADKEDGLIRSEGDLFLKGAQACLLTGVGGDCVFHPSEFYPAWTMETASDSLKTVLQVCSGWQSLARPQEQGVVA